MLKSIKAALHLHENGNLRVFGEQLYFQDAFENEVDFPNDDAKTEFIQGFHGLQWNSEFIHWPCDPLDKEVRDRATLFHEEKRKTVINVINADTELRYIPTLVPDGAYATLADSLAWHRRHYLNNLVGNLP